MKFVLDFYTNFQFNEVLTLTGVTTFQHHDEYGYSNKKIFLK